MEIIDERPVRIDHLVGSLWLLILAVLKMPFTYPLMCARSFFDIYIYKYVLTYSEPPILICNT